MSYYVIIGAIAITVNEMRNVYQTVQGLREEANFVYSQQYPDPDPNNYPVGQVPDRDAFRHAYTSATLVYHLKEQGYTSTEANLLAKAAGHANEWLNPNNTTAELYKDLYNNEQGREIGDAAESAEDIGDAVAEAMDNGDFVKDAYDENDDRIEENPDPFIDPEDPLEPQKDPESPDECPVPEDWFPPFEDGMGKAPTVWSPLVIDMDNDGVELTNLATGAVYWDIDSDGFREASAWVEGDDALLAVDLNADGIINNHSELFGTEAVDGFTVLSAYDSNNDDVIDSSDTDFTDLLIWQDANQDGISQTGELKTLTAAGIQSIALNASNVSYQLEGNPVTHQSSVTMSDSSTRTVVDVWFKYDNANTVYDGGFSIDPQTIFLPTLRGFGDIKELFIQMNLDATLLGQVKVMAVADNETLLDPSFDLVSKFKDMLYRWAEVDDLTFTNVDQTADFSRKVEFLDLLSGGDYYIDGETAGARQVEFIDRLWTSPFNNLLSDFLAQTTLKVIFENGVTYDPVSGTQEGYNGISEDGLESITDLIDLSGDKGYGWALIVRMVEGTVGINNLSNGDYDLLDSAIQSAGIGLDLISLQYAVKYEIADNIDSAVITDQFAIGTSGNDSSVYTSSAKNDVLIGHDGNDLLYGSAKNNVYIGGDGDDLQYDYYGGDDVYVYQSGDDKIYDMWEIEYGDKIVMDRGIELEDISMSRIHQSDPNSYYVFGQADLMVEVAGRGSIRIVDQAQYSTLYKTGVEIIEFADGTQLDLSSLDKPITGTSSIDSLVGLDRAYYLTDIINAGEGNDTLDGGLGNDFLDGGSGNDTYIVGTGVDLIKDSDGADEIVFDNTYNIGLFTFSYDATMNPYELQKFALKVYYDSELKVVIDQQFASSYSFVEKIVVDGIGEIVLSTLEWDIVGTASSDTLYAMQINGLNSVVYGMDGNDTIMGTYHDDVIHGGNGDDYIHGGYDGNDIIYGGDGDDTINASYGGYGSATIYGGAGADSMTGGYDADSFVFEANSAFSAIDTINDYNTGEGDTLNIADLLIGYTSGVSDINDFCSITDSGGNTLFSVDRDGAGGTYTSSQITTLIGVTGLDIDTLLLNNNLIAT